MKKQIRRGVFETNSSSVHTLTMCSGEEYKKWQSGEVLYWRDADAFNTREEIIDFLKVKKTWSGELYYPDVNWNDEDEVNDVFEEEGIQTCDEFFDNEYYETFYDDYTTPSGDKVVAFGYYGDNY